MKNVMTFHFHIHWHILFIDSFEGIIHCVIKIEPAQYLRELLLDLVMHIKESMEMNLNDVEDVHSLSYLTVWV